ncbi:regulatory protein GemA [bacterium]|nr:regulatory protein GemA [bacterium]
MATTSQIKRIHTLKSILGLEDDLYRDMLFSFGVCTSKDLTFTEAGVLLDILETKAVEKNLWKKQPKKYEDMDRGDKMATPPQLRMIKGLWREICYCDNDEYASKSLRKFMKAKFKVDDIRFLTKNKAIKVIQAIKGIQKRIKKGAAAL